MLIIILTGFVSYISIPKESTPEITVPNIIVNTVYTGVAPGDVENLVTRPLEEELNRIADVKTITSTSIEGYSSINVEFNADVVIEEAMQQVREKVDLAKPELPDAVEEPQIFEINFAEFPIMQVNVAGPYDLVRLREVAEDLQDELELISSVLSVDLAGGLEREVQVDVDLAKLQFYELSFNDVIDAIRAENVTIPGGSIDVGETKYLVRIPGEFELTAPIADIVIDTRGRRPIYVSDVATVDFGFKERDSFARLNGQPVVTLSVTKRSGENIIETAASVRTVVAGMEFPPGTEIAITSDESEDIDNMVSSLQNNIISGLLLVVAVLLFFLGVRTASFVGIAIPLSMLLSFGIMQIIGFTMNMVVLFSLILALGMLVDNGIVVVENIYRFIEQGFDKKDAAKFATAEVAVPIIASTLTTLAAFFPMTFWPGIVGEFMKFLPITLIVALSSSLFVALVITPTLCSLFLETEDYHAAGLTLGMKAVLIGGAALALLIGMGTNAFTTVLLALTVVLVYAIHHFVMHPIGHHFMTDALPRIIERYRRLLGWALGHRPTVVAGAVASLFLVVIVFGRLNAGIEFFPEDIPPTTVYVQVEAPQGTRVEQTDQIAQRIERRIAELQGREDFESVVSTVGQQIAGGFGGGGQGTHLATVAVNFVDYQARAVDAFQTLELMRETMATSIAGADISVQKPQDGPGGGLPINIEIIGEDADVLKDLADQAVLRL
ncbi:MAG: efflux RND transporter permease subunit, partial [Gemmatimonadota bacterium]